MSLRIFYRHIESLLTNSSIPHSQRSPRCYSRLSKMTIPRISYLAQEIVEKTRILNVYLMMNDLPEPSFEVDGPIDSLRGAPPEIQKTREEVIDHSRELQQLLTGNFGLLGPDVRTCSCPG